MLAVSLFLANPWGTEPNEERNTSKRWIVSVWAWYANLRAASSTGEMCSRAYSPSLVLISSLTDFPAKQRLLYRPQCYCLSRHILAVPSFLMRGITMLRLSFWISDCSRQWIWGCQSSGLMREVNPKLKLGWVSTVTHVVRLPTLVLLAARSFAYYAHTLTRSLSTACLCCVLHCVELWS